MVLPQDRGAAKYGGTKSASAAPARPLITSDTASPLTESHFHQLRQAIATRRPIRKAARTARASAITILAVGALGVLLLVFYPSWLGVLIVLGIGVVGVVEYVGAGRMRRGEPTAAVFLARNQVAFMALIVAYCLIRMLTYSPEEARSVLASPHMQDVFSLMPELRQDAEREVQQLGPVVNTAFYSLIIVLSLAFQGGLALYYHTRRRHLEALRHDTPEWITRLFRELDV